MRIAAVAGPAVYVGMLTVHTPALLLATAAERHLYRHSAGIGMLYFQDLMPGQAGAATTLYTNTTRVGWIIAEAHWRALWLRKSGTIIRCSGLRW